MQNDASQIRSRFGGHAHANARGAALFAEDAIIRDEANLKEYQGENLGGIVSDVARAFPDVQRELYDFYVSGDVVVVELSLNGTHTGPLEVPGGTTGATGEEFHAPCCDLRLLTQMLQS